jgi:hypothetical protein
LLARLRAKLLIFESYATIERFWRQWNPTTRRSKKVAGRVTPLFDDPRYFCAIGLVKGWLVMEVITHEAAHAEFCYARRVMRTPWPAARKFEEESVCYPAGIVAREINRFLHKRGLYNPSQVKS